MPATRPAPSHPPVLVRLLRAHIKKFGTTIDGRIFQTARGGILQDSGYNEVWDQARQEALTPAQYRSPLGRRPYPAHRNTVSAPSPPVFTSPSGVICCSLSRSNGWQQGRRRHPGAAAARGRAAGGVDRAAGGPPPAGHAAAPRAAGPAAALLRNQVHAVLADHGHGRPAGGAITIIGVQYALLRRAAVGPWSVDAHQVAASLADARMRELLNEHVE